MLTIGSVATNTFKKALDVTSHNVANVGTEGYSRQRAEITSNSPSIVGATMLGGGSRVDSVERVYADYIQHQLVSSQSSMSRYESQLQLSKQVEGVIASNDQGIQQFIQGYFDALQNLSTNPTSNTSRQVLLDEAGNLESHISNMTSVLEDTQYQVNTQVSDLTTEINSRLETVQTINEQVERALGAGQQAPNDLLDRRDQAILELSHFMDIKTFQHPDGGIDIHSSNGSLPLLSDNSITRLQADLSPYQDDNRVEIYMTIGGQKRVVSNEVIGGQLGGVLEFRDNMLDKAQNDLGVTLNGLVASMNWQHYQGYDMNGDAGLSFFTPLTMSAIGATGNSADGSAVVVSFNPTHSTATPIEPPYVTQPATYGDKLNELEAAMSEIGNFKSRDYKVVANGTDYQFYDHKSGELLTPTVVRPNVYQLDGLEFDFSAQTSVVGDSFLIKPHQQVLEDFAREITDTDLIAARGQSPVDTGVLGLDDEVPAAAAIGDNVNIANMAGLQSAKLLFSDENGIASETLLGGYSKMATNIGSFVRSSEIQLTAQTNVFQQIVEQRESYSGVSLDEEAANLIKYQQAYEAAAQIISASQSLFQTLLGAVRG